jgi:hypothetical protein
MLGGSQKPKPQKGKFAPSRLPGEGARIAETKRQKLYP